MKVFRNPDVLWREEDESTQQARDGLAAGENVSDTGTSVLFADGIMISLNLLGTEIWKLCDGRSVDDIVSELAGQFEVDPAVLKEDTMTFLDDLNQKGYVRYEDR